MTYRFLSLANLDLVKAMEYYDRASPGLGQDFLDEVERTIQRILLNPEAWMKVGPHSRRGRTRRFPYGVFYSIQGKEITILAILDLRQNPESWRTRIEGG